VKDRAELQVVARGGPSSSWCVLVHGGAGNVGSERRPLHIEGCRKAVRLGAAVLRQGGSALDAVEAAVRALEDDPLFNAGTGACLTADGRVEHDASIMEGTALRAGAVCALGGFAAPISVARAALDDGRHVFYAAHGAAELARSRGFVPVEEGALITDSARAALARFQQGKLPANWAGGTVGAVAREASGGCAAATSTGGTIGKLPGRVGDSPIVGAGTYADDQAGAVSTTGDGEAMIRLGAARFTVERMRSGDAAHEAARAGVEQLAARLDARGGLITIDRQGRWGFARSTSTMSWAVVNEHGEDAGA
jgi:beta-aspartyl-peptidase (threonine type)